VLQAADILIHRADVVPVGDDQAQHSSSRARSRASSTTASADVSWSPRPSSRSPRASSASTASTRCRSPATTRSPCSRRPDERGRSSRREDRSQRLRGPIRGGPSSATSSRCTGSSRSRRRSRTSTRSADRRHRCVDCKKILHASLVGVLDPIRSRAEALYREPDKVKDILRDGGRRARRRLTHHGPG